MAPSHEILLYVNGSRRQVTPSPPTQTLLEYLRRRERLTGAKLGCGEGGCGACTVLLSRYDRRAGRVRHAAVNACLLPTAAADGCAVTTVEGVGARGRLAPLQSALASAHASQCGFCTPGIIMSAFAALRAAAAERRPVTLRALQDALDGNLCRCTGYRPIIDALRTLVDDCGGEPLAMAFCGDKVKTGCGREDCCMNGQGSVAGGVRVEEAVGEEGAVEKGIENGGLSEPVFPSELVKRTPPELNIGGRWLRPVTLAGLFETLDAHPDARIVAGNTEVAIEARARAVEAQTAVYVSLSAVTELLEVSETETAFVVGAGLTWASFCEEVERVRAKLEGLGCAWKAQKLAAIVRQIKLFAGSQVRAVATIAGNIVTASPISDINPLWIAAEAEFVLVDGRGVKRTVPAKDFFLGYRKVDISRDEVLETVSIPWNVDKFDVMRAFKTSRRRDDDIAIVSAGIRLRLSPPASSKSAPEWTIAEAVIGLGGMAPKTIAAVELEEALRGKPYTQSSLQGALAVVKKSFSLPSNVPGGMPEFREALVAAFVFKAFIRVGRVIQQGFSVEDSKELEDVACGLVLDDRIASDLIHLDRERDLSRSGQVSASGGKPSTPNVGVDASPSAVIPSGMQYNGKSVKHAAAELQVSGEALYVDDMPPQSPDELHAAFVVSAKPHAKLLKVDFSKALEMPGVVDTVTSKDVQGQNVVGPTPVQDDYCFATDMVTCVGQPMALVVADTLQNAEAGAAAVRVEYEDLDAVVTVEEAMEAEKATPGSFVLAKQSIELGDLQKVPESAPRVTGKLRIGAQEHFYLEPNCTITVPGENDEFVIYSSTQSPSKTQALVARTLGVAMHKVVCRVKRIGGGFGGKETRSIFVATASAVAAQKLGRPVRLVLGRDIDMLTSGTRHAFQASYECAFDHESGRLLSLEMDLLQNAGNSHDLSIPVVDRALMHAFNAYDVPNARLVGYCLKTNSPSATAFRGFGAPQGMLVMENIIEQVAHSIGKDPRIVREVNLYGMHGNGNVSSVGMEFDPLPLVQCWNGVLDDSKYTEAREEVEKFNNSHKVVKRGIAIVPTMFGISFTFNAFNQAAALVHIYDADGSVLITHGGVEMGQGLHTKMCQVAATELRIPMSKVYISETSTDKVPNASPTAASASTDMYGMAVRDACRQLRTRLDEVADSLPPSASWQDIMTQAWLTRVDLCAHGFYRTPGIDSLDLGEPGAHGRPFFYYTNGAAVSVVEIDTLTGFHSILSTHIVMDIGRSLNPALDIGQIEGGFVQGLGWCTLEEVVRGSKSSHAWLQPGRMHTLGPGAYKIPGFTDIPIDFRVRVLEGIRNEKDTIHSSKGVGEPPLFLSSSVFFAIRHAIASARSDAGYSEWFQLDSPATVERIRLLCPDHAETCIGDGDHIVTSLSV